MKQDANAIFMNGGPEKLRDKMAEAKPFKSGGDKKYRFSLTPFKSIRWNANAEYLVKSILPLKGNVLIYGPPKCGKSFWIYDLAMCVARGLDYRGKRVRKGIVIYFAAEGGEGFKKRVEAYRRHHNCDEGDFYLCTVRPNLAADAKTMIADAKAQIGEHHSPALIIIDTVNRTLVGSENNPEDVSKYLAAQAEIEDEFKCCVVLVHHCGIVAGRPRGHTSFTGAADVQIAVTRDAAENVVAMIELAKDGPTGDEFVSRLETVDLGLDSDGEMATTCIVTIVDTPSQKKSSKKFSDQTELARRALADIICERGESNINVPAGLKGVPREVFRDECYRRGIGGETKEGRRRAFNRADEKLVLGGVMRKRDDFVWLANGGTQ
jgi:hypothetical protein